MDYIFLSFILLILIFALLCFILFKLFKKSEPTLEPRLKDLQETMDRRLNQGNEMLHKQMQTQLESSQNMISNLTKELTEIKMTGREMLSFTEQLNSLEKTLRNPKSRGVLGEQILEQVISNVLPPNVYEIQYLFKNGTRADAVVFLSDNKLIAIDAKFSLDNYSKLLNSEDSDSTAIKTRLREDLKARINETSKYILTSEGTLDYAFMFIPSESLYYDLLTQKIGSGTGTENLISYAFREKKVIIVSPTTLLAYLQTVQLGLKSLQIEEKAKEISKNVESLQKHMNSYYDYFSKLGKSLGAVINHYNSAQKKYKMIDKDFLKITGEEDKKSSYEELDAPQD